MGEREYALALKTTNLVAPLRTSPQLREERIK